MDMRRTRSFITSQSMGTKDICILVVHDDPMFRNIIIQTLENCSHYEVLKFQKVADALNTMREKTDRIDTVVTDVHQSNSNGFEILNYIEKEFKLLVVSMTPPESAGAMSVELGSSAKLYFMKSLSWKEFKTLWQYAYMKERGNATSFQRVPIIHEKKIDDSLESESPTQEVKREDQKQNRRAFEESGEQSEGDKDDAPNEKKQRVVWNQWMHQKFLEAIQQLGHDRAFPKKIVEIMNVPGLNREHVASHLQKYRMYLKRAQREMQSTSSDFGINSPPLRCFQSNHSHFNFSEQNHSRYPSQSPIYTSYQPSPSPNNIPIPLSSFSYPETIISTSNFGQQNFLVASNQVSLESPLANSSSLIPKTENNMSATNILSNLSYPLHPETSTSTRSNIGQHENPQPDSSNNSMYVGFRLTGNGKSVECGQKSAQNNNENTNNKLNFSNGNESLVQFPSTETDNNGEQQLYMHPAECEIEDLLDEIGGGGATSPQIYV